MGNDIINSRPCVVKAKKWEILQIHNRGSGATLEQVRESGVMSTEKATMGEETEEKADEE